MNKEKSSITITAKKTKDFSYTYNSLASNYIKYTYAFQEIGTYKISVKYQGKLIGKEIFQEVMQKYIKKYRYQSVDHTAFKGVLEETIKDKFKEEADKIIEKIDWDKSGAYCICNKC